MTATITPGVPRGKSNYQNGKTITQMAMTETGMKWADTQKYISYLPAVTNEKGQKIRFPSGDYVTGTVDMRGYLNWLNEHGYNINMTVH